MDKLLNDPHAQGKNLDRLLEKSTVLEMDALGQADKVFLISMLLLYIHHHRMAEGERETFKHAIMIEEAHHVLSNERRSMVGGQSVMEITFREIREFGESIIALDQHPSKISLSALGNTYCTFCLNLKHQKDVSAMAQSMLLDSQERDILGSLEVGRAVVKLQGRIQKPFLVEIPKFNIKKGSFTDDDVRQRMKWALPSGETTPRTDSPPPAAVPKTSPSKVILLPEGPGLAFLLDIDEFPESGVAERYRRIGLSVRQGQKLKKRLVEDGLLLDRVEITQTGRIRIVRLTEKGLEIVENGST